MDRLKSLISFWPVIAIITTLLGVGWGTREVVASKVDVSDFEPFSKNTEKRISKIETRDETRDEDIKLIKEQLWMVAIATHAAIVPQPLPKTAPDGGVK